MPICKLGCALRSEMSYFSRKMTTLTRSHFTLALR